MVKVKGHTRRTQNGRTIFIKPYNRSKPTTNLPDDVPYEAVMRSDLYSGIKKGEWIEQGDAKARVVKKGNLYFIELFDYSEMHTIPSDKHEDLELPTKVSEGVFSNKETALLVAKSDVQDLRAEHIIDTIEYLREDKGAIPGEWDKAMQELRDELEELDLSVRAQRWLERNPPERKS